MTMVLGNFNLSEIIGFAEDQQIPQAQFEARVPAHAPNDLPGEVRSSEQIVDRDEPLHLSIIGPPPLVFCARALWGIPQ